MRQGQPILRFRLHPCWTLSHIIQQHTTTRDNSGVLRVTDFTVATSCVDTYPHQYCDSSKSIVHVFILTEINVYTQTGSRTSRITISWIRSSSATITSTCSASPQYTKTSRHMLPWIRIKSSYVIVLYLFWNLSNNHPFLGDVISLKVQHTCDLLSTFVLVIKQKVITLRCFTPITCAPVACSMLCSILLQMS